MKYRVYIQRPVWEQVSYIVEAESEQAAKNKGLAELWDDANARWSTMSPEGEVDSVVAVEIREQS